MFVIVCNPAEEAPTFGYGAFETRADAEQWLELNVALDPANACDNEHDFIEIFRVTDDGGIA